jgi:hypothetical protein
MIRFGATNQRRDHEMTKNEMKKLLEIVEKMTCITCLYSANVEYYTMGVMHEHPEYIQCAVERWSGRKYSVPLDAYCQRGKWVIGVEQGENEENMEFVPRFFSKDEAFEILEYMDAGEVSVVKPSSEWWVFLDEQPRYTNPIDDMASWSSPLAAPVPVYIRGEAHKNPWL